jgi:UDP-glucose 4-epimerase
MSFNLESANTVLVIGAAGGLAQITIGLLCKHYPELHIVGIDNRTIGHLPQREQVTILPMSYTRGNFEKLFRDYPFDAVFHLGRLSHAKQNAKFTLTERLDLNVMGTSRILDLSLKFNVKKVLILSTYHVYGALADNPVFIHEDHPLRASIKYPELRDVTEMDQVATNWMWKHQGEIETVVLRPCNIIGPQINNSLTQYLRSSYAPVPIDFNPMFQFIHEFDMARVLIECLCKVPTGIYNVAPNESISLRKARECLGRPGIPVPITLLEPAALMVNKLWRFPNYLLDYVKFSCIISSSALGKHLPHEQYRFTTQEALELLKIG